MFRSLGKHCHHHNNNNADHENHLIWGKSNWIIKYPFIEHQSNRIRRNGDCPYKVKRNEKGIIMIIRQPLTFSIFSFSQCKNTVKLGYNDHSYNEITVIPNIFKPYFGSQMTGLLHNLHGYSNVTAIMNRYPLSHRVRYNRVWL